MANESTASRSNPNDRRRLPPPPLYDDPFAHVPPPMGYIPPPPPHYPPTLPPMGYMPPPPPLPLPLQSSLVPPPALPIPYTQTMPPLSLLPPPPPSLPPTPFPFWNNNYTQTLHPPLYFPPLLPHELRHMIRMQIEHYFSDDNLAREVFLKMNMDDNGWVPIKLIATFERVSKLTNDIPLIQFSLKDSETVEVEAGKVRRRNSWKKWIGFKSFMNVVPSEGVESKEESQCGFKEVKEKKDEEEWCKLS